jgi:hypothetical protein
VKVKLENIFPSWVLVVQVYWRFSCCLSDFWGRSFLPLVRSLILSCLRRWDVLMFLALVCVCLVFWVVLVRSMFVCVLIFCVVVFGFCSLFLVVCTYGTYLYYDLSLIFCIYNIIFVNKILLLK